VTTLATFTAEGTNGTAMTSANTGLNLVSGTWTFSNAHIPVGSTGATAAKVVATGSASQINGLNTWTATGQVWARVYVYVETLPSASTSIFQIRSGSSTVCEVRLTTAGAVQVRNANATQVAISGSGLVAAGTMLRIGLMVNAATSQAQVKVFVGANQNGTTADYDSGVVTNANNGLTTVSGWQAGVVNAATCTLHFDELVVNNTGFPGGLTTPMSTLTDDFATKDTTKWTWGAAAAVSGGQASFTGNSSFTGAITSASSYDLTGSALLLQVVQAVQGGTGSPETFLSLYDSGTNATNKNSLSIEVLGSTLRAYWNNSTGTQTVLATTPYVAATHKWWRIRQSSTSFFWDYSPDGLTWTQFATVASSSVPFTAMKAIIGCGGSGTTGPALVDNVNLTPPANVAPTCNAGADQTGVEPYSVVTLSGTDSDSDGTIASRAWSGTGFTFLTGQTSATATAKVRGSIAGETLTATYTVTDNGGATASDTVNVTVLPVVTRVCIGGVLQPLEIRSNP
jgi:hypothetical protein